MREIKYTNRFKRDYKREKAGRHGKKLDVVLMEAVNLLAVDALLPRRYGVDVSMVVVEFRVVS